MWSKGDFLLSGRKQSTSRQCRHWTGPGTQASRLPAPVFNWTTMPRERWTPTAPRPAPCRFEAVPPTDLCGLPCTRLLRSENGGEFGAIRHAELAVCGVEVALYRPDGDNQLPGDVGIGQAMAC